LEVDKARKDDKLKGLDQEILQVRSEIDKNKHMLADLTSNRDFLLSLCPEDFLAKRLSDHLSKKEAIKKKWIREHMASPSLDRDLIFKTDDEIHDNVKMQFSFHTKDVVKGAARVNSVADQHRMMQPQDWEMAFNTLLDLHLIEVTSDYYSDKLYFTNTKVITALFNKLELDNLQMIH